MKNINQQQDEIKAKLSKFLIFLVPLHLLTVIYSEGNEKEPKRGLINLTIVLVFFVIPAIAYFGSMFYHLAHLAK